MIKVSKMTNYHIIIYHIIKKSRLGHRKCPEGTTRAPITVNDKNGEKMLKNERCIL